MSEYINRALAVQELEVLRQEYEMHDDCDELVARRCRNAVSALPAADVAPVRHGRWIDLNIENSTGPMLKCSKCSHIHNPNRHDLALERVELKSLYCETCGALMDGKEEP